MPDQTNTYHHGHLRAALLAEAAIMVAEDGVERMTMRALGSRLGVSRAAPYRHFADKAALLVAVAAVGFDRLRARVQSIDEGASGLSADRFRRMGEEYVRFALENPAHYRLMYGKEALTRDEVPELRDAGNSLFEYLVSLIEAYQRGGLIKPNDARAKAYVAWSAVHGLASLVVERQIRTDVDVEALIAHTTEIMWDGMKAGGREAQ